LQRKLCINSFHKPVNTFPGHLLNNVPSRTFITARSTSEQDQMLGVDASRIGPHPLRNINVINIGIEGVEKRAQKSL
jgi:hypothetical protein